MINADITSLSHRGRNIAIGITSVVAITALTLFLIAQGNSTCLSHQNVRWVAGCIAFPFSALALYHIIKKYKNSRRGEELCVAALRGDIVSLRALLREIPVDAKGKDGVSAFHCVSVAWKENDYDSKALMSAVAILLEHGATIEGNGNFIRDMFTRLPKKETQEPKENIKVTNLVSLSPQARKVVIGVMLCAAVIFFTLYLVSNENISPLLNDRLSKVFGYIAASCTLIFIYHIVKQCVNNSRGEELCDAAAEGNVELLTKLLKEIPSNARGNNGETALHAVAAKWRSHGYDSLRPKLVACARLLLDKGADINAKNSEGEKPLHRALQSSSCALGLVELYIERRELNILERYRGKTYLEYAKDIVVRSKESHDDKDAIVSLIQKKESHANNGGIVNLTSVDSNTDQIGIEMGEKTAES